MTKGSKPLYPLDPFHPFSSSPLSQWHQKILPNCPHTPQVLSKFYTICIINIIIWELSFVSTSRKGPVSSAVSGKCYLSWWRSRNSSRFSRSSRSSNFSRCWYKCWASISRSVSVFILCLVLTTILTILYYLSVRSMCCGKPWAKDGLWSIWDHHGRCEFFNSFPKTVLLYTVTNKCCC